MSSGRSESYCFGVLGLEVSLMFKWLRPGRHSERDVVHEPVEGERDSGEEEYESQEEDALEVAPSGITRLKVDNI